MRFPVLMGVRRRAAVTFFSLVPRPPQSFVLAENLWAHMEDSPSALDFFMLCAERFFPWVLEWQMAWPPKEREALRLALGLSAPCRMAGDSWTLPLFFAFDCLGRQRPWPDGVLASGAIRHGRGLRCVSIGGASPKLRRARAEGCLCLLPRANVTMLRRRGTEVGGCVALPPRVEQCLRLWRQYSG
jgi:hypothetical protein